MGVDISRPQRDYTELYLPADTLRQCRANPCWCQGNHRKSRYMYVERGRDGREQYHDPLDYMDRFMDGGAWPSWKNPGDWTERDFDRLNEVMTNLNDRSQGRRMRGHGPGAAWMMQPNDYGQRCSMQQDGPPWDPDLDDMIARQVRKVARQYDRRFRNLNDMMFGSAQERMEDRFKETLFKHFRQFQQNGGMGMNGMGMSGMQSMGMQGMQMPGMMNQNMEPGMANMMPQQYATMGGFPGGMAGGYGGMPVSNMMPGGGLGGHMNGYGGGMYGRSLGPRRRGAFRGQLGHGRGPRMGFDGDEIDDEDVWGGGGGLHPGRGRGHPDMFDGAGYGDGTRRPRGSAGVRRQPRRPDDRPSGRGAVFEVDDIDPNLYRPDAQVPLRRAAHDGYGAAAPRPIPMGPDIVIPLAQSPPRDVTSPPNPRGGLHARPSTAAPFGGDLGQQRWQPPPHPGPIHVDDFDAGPGRGYYPHVDDGMGMRMPTAAQSHFPGVYNGPHLSPGRPRTPRMGESLNPVEPLARPRDEETRRGEPEAGAPAGTRDIPPR